MSASEAQTKSQYPLDYEKVDLDHDKTLRVTWPVALVDEGERVILTREVGLPVKYLLSTILDIVKCIPMTLGVSQIKIDGRVVSFVLSYAEKGALELFISQLQALQNSNAVAVCSLHLAHDGCTCGDPNRPNHTVCPPEG